MKYLFNIHRFFAFIFLTAPLIMSQTATVDGGKIKIEFNNKLYSRVILNIDEKNIAL